jgi:hypothetical protein
LTNKQLSSIRYILQHPNTTPELREKTNQILYEKYKGWTCYQANDFKKKHYYLCRHIPKKELEIYAIDGLLRAIQKYNPKFSFSTFLYIYVHGSLFKGTNQLQPMTTIPLYKRNYKKWSLYRKQERKKLSPILLPPNEYWQFEKRQIEKESDIIEGIRKIDAVEEIREKLITLKNPRDKLIFYYKYFSGNKVRTNKDISELMALSEETIRTSIQATIKNLQLQNNNLYIIHI